MTSFTIYDITTNSPRNIESLDGLFEVNARYWDNQLISMVPTPVKYRKCEQEDFDQKFFEPAKQDAGLIEVMKSGMICIQPDPEEELLLSGSIVSESKFLELGISRCQESENNTEKRCKSREEIDAVIDQSSFVFFYNT